MYNEKRMFAIIALMLTIMLPFAFYAGMQTQKKMSLDRVIELAIVEDDEKTYNSDELMYIIYNESTLEESLKNTSSN